MPTKPARPCSTPGCPGKTPSGRCERCRGRASHEAGIPVVNPYGGVWRAVRLDYLTRHWRCLLCGRHATVADHFPISRRRLLAHGVPDPDSDVRLRPLCAQCHNAETALRQPGGWNSDNVGAPTVNDDGPGRITTVVAGPPCSGKTTYVRDNRGPDDLVVDLDALRLALGAEHEHDDSDVRLPFALAAKDAVMSRLMQRHSVRHVWLIACAPRRVQRLVVRGAAVVVLDVPAALCHERAARERPAQWHALIDAWFRDYER